MKYYVSIIYFIAHQALSGSPEDSISEIEDSITLKRTIEEELLSNKCPNTYETTINYKNQNIDFEWDLNSGISGHLSRNRNGLKIIGLPLKIISTLKLKLDNFSPPEKR